MPIENEQKYVLRPQLEETNFASWKRIEIRQGYLDDGPRIRQYGDNLVFTYKRWIDDADTLVEIECPLSQRDFDYLFPFCNNLVQKTRFVKNTGEIEWAVDFLKNKMLETYFILAEAEMPEGMDVPALIPEELKDKIILTPAKGDKNFTNKNLSDENHAKKILRDLK